MAAVLNILSPAYRQRKRGPRLSIYIPDTHPLSHSHGVSTTFPTPPSISGSSNRTPSRPRNRLRKRPPGPKTPGKPPLDIGRETWGDHGFFEGEVQTLTPHTERGTPSGLPALDKLDTARSEGNSERTNASAVLKSCSGVGIAPQNGVGNQNIGLGLRLRRGREPGRHEEGGKGTESWYLSFPPVKLPSSCIVTGANSGSRPENSLALHENIENIHPAYRNVGAVANYGSSPFFGSNFVSPINFDSASDSDSGLELSRLKSDDRRNSASSSIYPASTFTSPATSISDNVSPNSGETENEDVDIPALIISAERLASEYRALLLSRAGTPLSIPSSLRSITPDPLTGRGLGRGKRIVRKVKGIHSLRKLVRGAEREIEQEWGRMRSAGYSNGVIIERRFSFSKGDDTYGIRTSGFSDAETLVAVMGDEFDTEKWEPLKEEDQQPEQQKEDHIFEDLGLRENEEEELEIPPRHPGRVSRAWMATTPITPTAAAAELDTKQTAASCCRRRSREESPQDSLRLPVKLRVDEVCFREFCEGCRKKVVWMADATEMRRLNSDHDKYLR